MPICVTIVSCFSVFMIRQMGEIMNNGAKESKLRISVAGEDVEGLIL